MLLDIPAFRVETVNSNNAGTGRLAVMIYVSPGRAAFRDEAYSTLGVSPPAANSRSAGWEGKSVSSRLSIIEQTG